MVWHDIRDYGAVGDGAANDAPAIQRAIDACHAAGGGRVVVPAGGTYRSGSIVLRSHVELHLERGATLKASAEWSDITARRSVSALTAGVAQDAPQSGIFITAEGATDVAITGGGTIDGSGPEYAVRVHPEIYEMSHERPFTVFLVGCDRVLISDVRIVDGALWTVRLSGCTDVRIAGISIANDMRVPNADGIDIDRCKGVRISDCLIVAPDDAICLKASEEFSEYGACEDVTVTNCVVETRSSGLVVGVDATSPIRNVTFDSCVVRASNRGLSLSMGQDSVFENIVFSNIVVETRFFAEKWWGSGEPIYVHALPWQDSVGTIRKVLFSNIRARSENGVYVVGHAPGSVCDIVFSDVRIELDTWSEHAQGRKDLRPWSGGEELTQTEVHGFNLDTADRVTLRDCEVVWGSTVPGYFAEPLVTRNVRGLRVEGLVGSSAQRHR